MSEISRRFGQRVATLRKRAGLTQARLGAAIGTTPEMISRIENGGSAPDVERVVEIAEVLGVEPHLLLLDADPVEGKREAAMRRIEAIVKRLSPEEAEWLAAVVEVVGRRGRR